MAQFTFLNKNSFYTISSLIDGKAEIFLTSTGANDPNFNIRKEPSYIIRKKAANQTFLNVIEIHGDYDPVYELSSNAYSAVQQIKLLQSDEDFTVVEILIANKKLQLIQSNKNFGINEFHSVRIAQTNVEWKGPFNITYEGKKYN